MKQLAKRFIIYSSGAITLRVITAFSALITVHIFSVEQFGLLALLSNTIVFLPIVSGLGLRQVLAIEYFRQKNTWQLVWKLTILYLIFAVPLFTALLLNTNTINEVVFSSKANPHLIAITLAISFKIGRAHV